MKLKYFISFIITASFIGQHSFAQMQPPAAPQYETCQQVEVENGAGMKYMQTDQACLARNSSKQKQYAASMEAYNRGTQIITSDTAGMKEPTKPTYETCNQNTDSEYGGYDYACVQRNQAKEREYQTQMMGYNQAKSDLAKAEAEKTAEQKALAETQAQQSSKAAMEEAQQKNKKGSQIYQIASMACGMAAAYYAMQWASTPCGPQTPGFCTPPNLAKAVAFAMFSAMAAKQAQSHDSVAHSACQSANRVATNAADCGSAPPPYNPGSFPSEQLTGVNGLFDSNGKCISTPEKCNGVIAGLPPGTNIKDVIGGLKGFASSKSGLKVNPDGSITAKNGKKFTPSNFSSEKDMMAAGLSAAEAKSLMADLNKFNASSALNAKAALKEENSNISGSFGDTGGAGSAGGKANDNAANGLASKSKDMESTKREPASAEGLVKDFNGELIGVAGDDIFKMMNRRYKLKTAQDSFIGP